MMVLHSHCFCGTGLVYTASVGHEEMLEMFCAHLPQSYKFQSVPWKSLVPWFIKEIQNCYSYGRDINSEISTKDLTRSLMSSFFCFSFSFWTSSSSSTICCWVNWRTSRSSSSSRSISSSSWLCNDKRPLVLPIQEMNVAMTDCFKISLWREQMIHLQIDERWI